MSNSLNLSTYAQAKADLYAKRSTFYTDPELYTTFNAGKLIPIECKECMPGGTYSLTLESLVRTTTPITPVFGEAFIDLHFFFVPFRLVWDDYAKFFGENTDSWVNATEYATPKIDIGAGVPEKSLLSYLVPTKVSYPEIGHESGKDIVALQVRSICKCWNDWYRSEVTQYCIDIPTDSINRVMAAPSGDYLTTSILGGDLLPVNKYADYFTTALREPQKGDDVRIPIEILGGLNGNGAAARFSAGDLEGTLQVQSGGNVVFDAQGNLSSIDGSDLYQLSGLAIADDAAIGPTINQLRQSFAIQQILEADAVFGSRYTEFVRTAFGTVVPDYRANRSEYIGGRHLRMGMNQVVQTSATNETSPQGHVAAFSVTGDRNHIFTYSCVEHGYLLGFAMCRTENVYQQGLERQFTRDRRFDFYDPRLIGIGDQPIRNDQLFMTGRKDFDEEAFGFAEAWADYNNFTSRVTGEFRSNFTGGSLDVWHYADFYESMPTLSDEWLQASAVNLDRTLAISSSVSDQLKAAFKFNYTLHLPKPVHTTPAGLTL